MNIKPEENSKFPVSERQSEYFTRSTRKRRGTVQISSQYLSHRVINLAPDFRRRQCLLIIICRCLPTLLFCSNSSRNESPLLGHGCRPNNPHIAKVVGKSPISGAIAQCFFESLIPMCWLFSFRFGRWCSKVKWGRKSLVNHSKPAKDTVA